MVTSHQMRPRRGSAGKGCWTGSSSGFLLPVPPPPPPHVLSGSTTLFLLHLGARIFAFELESSHSDCFEPFSEMVYGGLLGC